MLAGREMKTNRCPCQPWVGGGDLHDPRLLPTEQYTAGMSCPSCITMCRRPRGCWQL